ncbi:MAG: TIGR02266 family protein [Nitrospirae bacterium]|nr:TIGR02266 family protein [Nitrospirota bacterium]
MPTKSGDDRRKDRRFDVKIKVDYSTKGMFVSNYVTNLSKGGVFIQTEDPLPLQSRIHLTFTLPEFNITIKAKGKVTWTYDIKKGTSTIIPGMGIKLTDLTAKHKALIEDYIGKLSTLSGTIH